MLEKVCAYIHNYFVYGRYSGTFTISGGQIDLPFLAVGQYYRICGSRMNDGVYRYRAEELYDETFTGVIWEMRPPRAFTDLVERIGDWQTKFGDTVNGPYQSESFGGYSYTKATTTNASGQSVNATWQTAFEHELAPYRRINDDVSTKPLYKA